ncbi:ATP-binding protein [Gelatiniphilus marinus]|uniref:histidine kinase n=1 Tax=Gelatiniphilus marinus TaxID=1759464 RepID=A0ABW5JU54_9FLAO
MKFTGLKDKLFFFMLFCLSVYIFGQNNINFKHLSPQINNSNIFINKTTQDSLGNIWMVCAKGILKYNGYSYKLITKQEIFPEISNDDWINNIHSDKNKNFWITSDKGLVSHYNSYLGKFENKFSTPTDPIELINPKENEVWFITKTGQLYNHTNNKTEMLVTIPNINGTDNKARSMAIGNNKEIYISTSKGKIYVYSKTTKILSELVGPYTDYPGLIALQIDQNNKLWIGTEAFGLLIYDIEEAAFVQDRFFKERINLVNKEFFIMLFIDSNNNIWGGTDGDGLYKINNKTGDISIYKKDNANKFSLNSNTILHINEDNHQNIWIVTNHGTVDVAPKPNTIIKHHNGSNSNIPLRTLSVFKSNTGILWIGTDGTGLTKVEKGTNKTTSYFNDNKNGFYVQSITEDDKNNIWFGTYKNGLWFHDTKLNSFKKIPVINSKNQKATDIRTVFKDSKGRIWVGSNIALNLYNDKLNLIASFSIKDKKGLNGIILESILEDAKNNIWLGMQGGGLFKFNENSNTIKNSTFTNYNGDYDQVANGVKSMCIGKENNLWLVTYTGKLFTFNTSTKTYTDLSHIKSLNPNLNAIISEDPNNIWISSSKGIQHFNTKTNSITTFYTSDGFQNNYYMPRSAFKEKNGILYFGSKEGVNFFDPKKLTKEKPKPKLFINNIQVLNKPAEVLLENQITSDVYKLNSLYLESNQSSFTVKFAAIDNILNPNFSYSYKLDGFDKDWKTTHTEGLATYTNIPPGQYVLDIKASEMNQTNVISRKKLAITIKPSFWNTPLAYALYLVLFILLMYGISKWYYLRKKLLINKISRRKENQLHDDKMNFFTKMSHEIQTPITLILGPIDDMYKRAETEGNMLLKERLSIIKTNAIRLSRIARELTLIKNKELDRLKLSVTKNNLYTDLIHICSSFKELARNKNIDFSLNCPKNIENTWYDKDKLEHILYNLLSNAFKFTPKEGNIQLSVAPLNKKSYVKITVSDSGPGINKDELNKIFEIFYRSESNNEANGTGVGLALTKELVNLHKGKIKAESNIGHGCTFTVKLPISEKHYSDTERITHSNSNEPLLNTTENIDLKPSEVLDKTKKTILIVEDNFELQNFLKDLFNKQFNILLAENGQEGFYYAKNNIPDLIISDVMMPIMDGIEMCKNIKKNNLTKHIPIILLTAKNSTKAKIEGLKTGAIEYINKPFNTNELLLKVNNIFASKEDIISKFRKELINKPEIKINKSQDEIFLEKLVAVVNERLKDPSFKVEELTTALNMSYSSLYRKCLTLTGLKLIDFVKTLRLKKAAILLLKYGYTISEVAYMVGYNNPKYFSKNFKSQFSITPKEFLNKAVSSQNMAQYLKSFDIDMDSVDLKNLASPQ